MHFQQHNSLLTVSVKWLNSKNTLSLIYGRDQKRLSVSQTSRTPQAKFEPAQEAHSKVARTSAPSLNAHFDFDLILSTKPLKPKFCYMILPSEKHKIKQATPVGYQKQFYPVKILKSKIKFTLIVQFSTIVLFKQIGNRSTSPSSSANTSKVNTDFFFLF